MKSLAILLLLIGIIMIVIGYTKSTVKCPLPRIEYRLVPQTFLDEQLNTNNVDSTFKTMFESKDPWFGEDPTTATTKVTSSDDDRFYTSL